MCSPRTYYSKFITQCLVLFSTKLIIIITIIVIKVRDVALSPSASSLAWSHTDSSITSSVLVAAALSNGIIALLCAGPVTTGEYEDSSYSASDSRSRARGNRDRMTENNRNTTRNKISDTSLESAEDNKSTIKSCPVTFGKRRSYLETHEGDVNSIAFHPDGRFLASGGFDRSVAVHDVVATKCIKHFQGHQSAVSHVTYNPFGNLIISSSRDGTVKFWDTLSGICIRTIVPTLLVSKGNSNNNSCNSTNKANKKPSSSIPSTFYSTTNPTSDHQGGAGNMAFSSGEILSTEMSADGRYLLVTPKLSAVRILDLRKGEVVSRINTSDKSYDDDYKRYKNKNTTAKNNNGGTLTDDNDNSYEDLKKNDRQNRNNSGEIFSTLSATPPFSKGSFSLAKRRDIFLQRACFCSEGSIGASFFFS